MSATWKVCFVLVLLAGAGCSGRQGGRSEGPGRSDELREVGSMLSLYSGQYQRGPARVADLAGYEAGHPLGYQAVRSGEVVVVWGTTMPGEGDKGGTNAVVAYEKKVPTEGGLVLLHNGKVRSMTADAFRSATQAR